VPSAESPNAQLPRGMRAWVAGARPRTLPAAVVPVLVGTAVAHHDGRMLLSRAALALIVSLALQIGVNYANDYSDGIRGTDEARVGPLRLVGSHIFSPRAVKLAAFTAFGIAAFAGLILALQTTLWLIVVGLFAIAAAWFYTGGPRPYGYAGLGELFVFVFFGLVAVIGTVFVQTAKIRVLAILAAVPVGLFAVAILIVNNLRDIPGDTTAGKKTMAVRLGDKTTRILYVSIMVVAVLLTVPLAIAAKTPLVLVALVAGILVVPPMRTVSSGTMGRGLIPVLGATGKAQLAFGVLASVGLFLG
jgi:1,4-dihydroxy-2-naphthoate polyprenyltransferase